MTNRSGVALLHECRSEMLGRAEWRGTAKWERQFGKSSANSSAHIEHHHTHATTMTVDFGAI